MRVDSFWYNLSSFLPLHYIFPKLKSMDFSVTNSLSHFDFPFSFRCGWNGIEWITTHNSFPFTQMISNFLEGYLYVLSRSGYKFNFHEIFLFVLIYFGKWKFGKLKEEFGKWRRFSVLSIYTRIHWAMQDRKRQIDCLEVRRSLSSQLMWMCQAEKWEVKGVTRTCLKFNFLEYISK